MRALLAAMALVLLLAPRAWAQTAARMPPRAASMPAESTAQGSFTTSYLLELYLNQLASAGTPPSQADIDEATRQYFTNGAAATGVPASGPNAAYFHDGAAVTGAPSSGPGSAYFHNGAAVLAYGRPVATASSKAGRTDAAPPASASRATTAGAPSAPAGSALTSAAAAAPTTGARPGASLAAGPACATIDDMEAAMAITSAFEGTAEGAAASPAATSCPPGAAPPPAPRCPPTSAVAPAPTPPSVPPAPEGRSLPSRIAAALGGALLGGLAVALWTRPRQLRVARRRS